MTWERTDCRLLALARPLLLGVLSLALWEAFCRALNLSEFVLPRPSQLATVLLTRYAVILPHALQTAVSTFIGFVLGVACGFVSGVILGASRHVHRMIYPSLIGFNSIPKVAFIPVVVLWFGIGAVPAVITAALICAFPIVVVVSTSVATVEPELNDVLRALGARHRDILLRVAIPRSMPYFFGSLKIAITLAFIGSVTSETVAANAGLGFMMNKAASDFDVLLVFTGLITLGLMGVLFYVGCVLIEGRVTGWAFRSSAAGT